MTTLYNVTEAKNKLAYIGKNLKAGEGAIFLKNGKELFVAITPEDFNQYKEYEEEKRVQIWSQSLPSRDATKNEEDAFLEAKKERNLIGRSSMSASEMMNFL